MLKLVPYALVALVPSFVFPLAVSAQSTSPPAAGDPVAIVAGQPIFEQELRDSLGTQQWVQLQTQEYEIKSKALDNLIRLKVAQAEAKKRGISAEKLIEQEVDSKVPEPTDGEVEAYFLGQNRGDATIEEQKAQYRANLKQLRVVKARQAYADSLRARTSVAILMRPPAVDVAIDAARVKGNLDAPVTIVEFSDYECPFCRKAESILRDVLDQYKGRVKLAYRDFPLREIHPHAEAAAEASRCAGEQGRFWEFHDALLANGAKLDDSDLIARARSVGLQEAPFQACRASGKFRNSVAADREAGEKAGVAGTPGFFINGVFLSGAQSSAEFRKAIDLQLSLNASAKPTGTR